MVRSAPPLFKTTTVSKTRLLPPTHSTLTPTVSPLSIIDCRYGGLARFPAAAIWAYPSSSLSTTNLTKSLQQVLDYYPQWCGQLRFVEPPADPSHVTDHTKRFGRLEVAWGYSTDPGIELLVSETSSTLSSVFPSLTNVQSTPGACDMRNLDAFPFFTSGPTILAPGSVRQPTPAGLPSLVIEIVNFACGGIAIAVEVAHSLADATSLHQFMRDWAALHRSLSSSSPRPPVSTIFNSSLVDTNAAGDVDRPSPDPLMLETADAIPCGKRDLWASTQDCPVWLQDLAETPELLREVDLGPMRTPVDWNVLAPKEAVRHLLVHFTEAEVRRMKLEAMDSATSDGEGVSGHDAVLAHVWGLSLRARGLDAEDTRDVHLLNMVGVRERLGLPSNLMGSPVFSLTTTSTPSLIANSTATSLSPAATLIRKTLNTATRAAVAALLHSWAYEAAPWRYWQSPLSEHMSAVTSWIRTGSWSIAFEETVLPSFVSPLYAGFDGFNVVMDGGVGGGWKGGVSVNVWLYESVAEKFLEDKALRRFR